MNTTTLLPVARSWRVTKDNRWRAEACCPTHYRKTTRFVEAKADGTWVFECRPTLPDMGRAIEPNWHFFTAMPREGAQQP
jgi:hypothetical protein